MASGDRNQGPWTHRVLVWCFTIALGILCFWLTGFVLSDIGNWPGPDFEQLERAGLPPELVESSKQVARDIEARQDAVGRDTQRQETLKASTDAAQRTMNQLLDFQRLAIERGVTPSPEEQKALADSQRIFLENQAEYEQLNRQIASREEERITLLAKQQEIESELTKARAPIEYTYGRQWEQHRWRIAAAKLGVMLPLLVVAVILFRRGRRTLYAPLIYAFGAAVITRVVLVMHEYFPRQYFKYVLILASLWAVLRILLYLVRAIAHPKPDWLVRQYREAYERFLCPICEYPIRRGPLKYLFWTRRTAKRLPQLEHSASTSDQPYTCPMCATRLFEKCPNCTQPRHTLLPACEHCGATRPLEEIAQLASGGQSAVPATSVA